MIPIICGETQTHHHTDRLLPNPSNQHMAAIIDKA
jgi:hypothetical protein